MYKKLSASVILLNGHCNKCKTLSGVSIRFGPLMVAHAILGGKYSPEQGIKEFKKNPGRFQTYGDGFQAAKLLGLVA